MVTFLQRTRGALRTLQTLWAIAGVTLIAMLLAEAGLRLVFAIKDHFTATEQPDRRVIAEGYGGESWPIQHYRELERLQDRWQPYVYFRQRPLSGPTVAIDPDGLRLTWKPPAARSGRPEAKPYNVLMLGGSSLWGFGARDDRTIPSLVARKLYEQGVRVLVKNLAEIGYVSTQEVVALVRELQSGYRPDLVIFYDGVNDSTSALLEGEAGVTTNERNRRDEFNIRQSAARLGAAMIARLLQDSASYRFAQVIGRRLAGARGTMRGLPPADRRKELVSEVVRRYRANLAMVDQLGRGYGFTSLYYWQPVVFDKTSLTSYEREEADKLAWARGFLGEVYEAIRASRELRAEPRFHDMSRLFADSGDLIFIDYCHTTESGNERIAETIARDALVALRSVDRGHRGGDPRIGDVR
jgi:lysophospholipase L1-like esterase